jgi:hypothetical protein
MNVSDASGRPPQPLTEDEAAELALAREHMLARHKLIEGMIRNNELQLKNESARGGAEIERECALRDMAKPGAGPAEKAELETVTSRLRGLEAEHRRLVAEREWLNTSLLEFESGASNSEHKQAGHA